MSACGWPYAVRAYYVQWNARVMCWVKMCVRARAFAGEILRGRRTVATVVIQINNSGLNCHAPVLNRRIVWSFALQAEKYLWVYIIEGPTVCSTRDERELEAASVLLVMA